MEQREWISFNKRNVSIYTAALLCLYLAVCFLFFFAGTPVTQQKTQLAYTQTPLASGATYVSPTLYVGGYARITLMVYADEDSASEGIQIQQSGDGDCMNPAATPNWDYESLYTYEAETKGAYSIEIVGRCARISFTNSSNAQGEFRLYGSLRTY